MKIIEVRAFQLPIPLRKPYRMSGNRSVDAVVTTILAIRADDGHIGWGEACPFGSSVHPDMTDGILPALDILSGAILGEDPRAIDALNARMERVLVGNYNARAAVDMACWDLAAQKSQVPLYVLLGGQQSDGVPGIDSHGNGTLEERLHNVAEARRLGYRKFSIKINAADARDPAELIEVLSGIERSEGVILDGNGRLNLQDTMRLMAHTREFDYVIEQPCFSVSQCASIRARGGRAMVLDEAIITPTHLLEAIGMAALDSLSIKPGRIGGLTRGRIFRDICLAAGIGMWVKDVGGTEITTAANMHLAQTVPSDSLYGLFPQERLYADDVFGSCYALHAGSFRIAPGTIGIGVVPDAARLGNAITTWSLP